MKDTRIYSPSISLEKLIALRHYAEGLHIQSSKKRAAGSAGIQRSAFRGRGMDFDEVRRYQPGDDIRNMDWRVTARTGKPHTKLYHEERERPVYFILDFNPAMFFGSKVTFKSVIAAQIAGLLTGVANLRGDRIGGILFSGAQSIKVQPQSGRRGTLGILKNISKFSESESNIIHKDLEPQESHYDLLWALKQLRSLAKAGSSIFIVSDFSTITADDEGCLTQLLSQLGRHNDISAFFIYDILEAEPPQPNRYTISNGKSLFQFDSANKTFRKSYQNQFVDKLNRLDTLFGTQKISLIKMRTDDDVINLLRNFYRKHR